MTKKSKKAKASSKKKGQPHAPRETNTKLRTVAVIDIGATSIRMEIAEIRDKKNSRTLETLQRPVRLGKDTFTLGRIELSTIRDCIEILKGYRKIMDEYGITNPSDIRAISTSPVREASNRDTFLDRIYNTTQINVQTIDESEENRLIFLAAQDVMADEPSLRKCNTLIIEVGGGSTELLLLQKGQLKYADTFRLGSLRMRETLETYHATGDRIRSVLKQHINQTIEQVRRSVPTAKARYLLAMAGDARFAASHLDPEWKNKKSTILNVKDLKAFVDKILPLPVEKMVTMLKMTPQEAETAGPALLVYVLLANAFKVDYILVPKCSLREGLLKEMASQGAWTSVFTKQVLQSASTLGKKYMFDEKHSRHVASLAARLYKELEPEHRLDKRFLLLLEVSALLHDIGTYINNRSHHKHSKYIIENSDLFGISKEDKHLVSLIARYHRRGTPRNTHPEFRTLDRDDRIAVAKLSAILRVADALDRAHTQRVKKLSFSRENDRFVITVSGVDDVTLERLALRDKGTLFQDYYGLSIMLNTSRESEGTLSTP